MRALMDAIGSWICALRRFRLLLAFSTAWFAVATAITPPSARAASISGILLYAADGFGTPNGYATYDACSNIEAQLWRTAAAGKWHGLAVYLGLPPESLSGPPLNARNFLVEIPLNEGDNSFTLVGEPGPLTATDEYERFAINLYFNGDTENVPGLSALFERYAAPMGSPVTQNRSHCIYTLSLNEVQGKPDLVYDDGVERVTVTAASFLSQERFDPDWNFDLVGRHTFGPSGTRDWIGVLRVFVEPSVSAVDAGAAPRAIIPAQPRTGFGSGAGFAPAAMPGLAAPAAGGNELPSTNRPQAGGPSSARASDLGSVPTTARIPRAQAHSEETQPEAEERATSATPAGTPSPPASPATPGRSPAKTQSPSPGYRGTPTPPSSSHAPTAGATPATPRTSAASPRTSVPATPTPAKLNATPEGAGKR